MVTCFGGRLINGPDVEFGNIQMTINEKRPSSNVHGEITYAGNPFSHVYEWLRINGHNSRNLREYKKKIAIILKTVS